MFVWLADNIGTIVILLVLILIVCGIVCKLAGDRKKGRSSCGGNCAHCGMCASARGKQKMTGSAN